MVIPVVGWFSFGKLDLTSSRQRPQVLASLAASLGLLTAGTVVSWTSTALPSLLLSENFKNITAEEGSWVGSLVPLGAVFSSTICGLSLDRMGRKLTMILTGAVLVFGWLLIASSTTVPMLCLGRFVSGACVGFMGLSTPVYIADISESEIRGSLASFSQVMNSIGILFSFILGSFVTWQWLAVWSAFISFSYMASVMAVPESPRFLLDNGYVDEAVLALCWLRGTSLASDVEDEIHMIQKNSKEVRSQAGSLKAIFAPRFLKPTMVSSGLMVFQQLAGYNALLFYTVDIFSWSGSAISPFLSTIIVGLILTIVTMISAILIDLSGRRYLMMTSGTFMAIALLSLGSYFFVTSRGLVDVLLIQWIPLTALLVFFAAYGIGFGPITWLIMTEIIPNPVIGIASGFCTTVHYTFAFLVTKYFQNVIWALGIDWCFWIFGLCCIFGTALVYFTVPETKLKTLEEIQLFFGPRLSISIPNLSRRSSAITAYKTFQTK